MTTNPGPQKISAELREGGVYTLPNGMVLVARKVYDDYFLLHDLIPDSRIGINYAVSASGGLMMLRPHPMSWNAGDLTDTGRTEAKAAKA